MKRKDNTGRMLKTGESQRKDKTYMYRWTNLNGKRECLYAKTLEELREKEELIQKELSLGITRTNKTLNDEIINYLNTKSTLAKTTKENYKYFFDRYISSSRLGNMKLVDIKKSHVLIFYNDLYENNLSAGTIKIVHKIIHPALQLACDDNDISKNPSDGCTRAYVENVEKKYALTLDEEKEFLDRLKCNKKLNKYYPMMSILLKTGMRISEAIGLTWNDVDMSQKKISINHQVQHRRINGKMVYFASETKTNAGTRILDMDDELYYLFKLQWEIWMKVEKDSEFEVDGYSNFVFISYRTGKCMDQNYTRKVIRRVVDMNSTREIQLPSITPHILRHTRCTRLAEAQCDIRVLQYLMGHTDIRTTMQTYNHVDNERVKREMSRIQTQNSTPIVTPNYSKVV